LLRVRISDNSGRIVAEGTCSESGYFPAALAGIYNAGRHHVPARSLEVLEESDVSADYPVGVRHATFGYSVRGQPGASRHLDEVMTVHVERG